MNTADLEAPHSHSDTPDDFNLLVSQERSQKFDLLLHLVNNLTQPLVVFGPEGIGKSTFLKHVVSHSQMDWEICYLSVTSDINLDAIQKTLLNTTEDSTQFQHDAETVNALTRKLHEFSGTNQLLVLILDNAGCLEPGLLKTILDFVESQPALRLVLALRPDDLHIKASTDYGVESCHFIDIPPLSEQDTEKYLRMMPPAGISQSAVTPELVAKVYRQSHGVPDTINSVAAKIALTGNQPRKNLLLPVVFGIAVLIAISMSYFSWKSKINTDPESSARTVTPTDPTRNHVEEVLQPPLVSETNNGMVEPTNTAKQNGTAKDDSLPYIENNAGDSDRANPSEVLDKKTKADQTNKTVAKPFTQVEVGVPKPTPKETENSTVKTESEDTLAEIPPKNPTAVNSIPQIELPIAGKRNPVIEDKRPAAQSESTKTAKTSSQVALHDQNWLLSQNPQHFALQLMASTNMADLHDFVAKYPQLKPLAYYRIRKGKTDWYKLLHGDYPSLKAANGATLKLPSGLRKAWPRKLSTVQKEISIVDN